MYITHRNAAERGVAIAECIKAEALAMAVVLRIGFLFRRRSDMKNRISTAAVPLWRPVVVADPLRAYQLIDGYCGG